MGPVKLFPPKYDSHRNLVLPQFLAELHEALLATHNHEYLFPAIGGGLLANVNFSYHYWRRIAVETRMGHEVAGVEGLYSNVTLLMEQQIANSLQLRWLRFMAREGDKLTALSPTALPVDLQTWWKRQVMRLDPLTHRMVHEVHHDAKLHAVRDLPDHPWHRALRPDRHERPEPHAGESAG
jgi:hypothetical protein